MFCEKCGKELKEDWVKCPYCEQVVVDNIKADKKVEIPQQMMSHSLGKSLPPEVSKKDKKILFGIGGAVAAVIAVAVIAVAVNVLVKSGEWKGTQEASEEVSNTQEDDYLAETGESDAQQDKDDEYVELEGLLGVAIQELEEIGFIHDEDEGYYQLTDTGIIAYCLDGKVNVVNVLPFADKSWRVHGINIGMDVKEAEALLIDRYRKNETRDSYLGYIDEKSGNIIGISYEKEIVTAMAIAQQFSEELPEEPQEEQPQEYIFPDSNSRYLSEEEVRSVEADKLRIARNEIFARHGYIFNDEELNQYFNSTSWYQGIVPSDQFDMDWVLNDFEKKNIELISLVEESNRESSPQAETIHDVDVVGGYANITEIVESLIKNNENIVGQKVAFCGWGFYHDSDKIELHYFEGEDNRTLVTAHYDPEKMPTMGTVEPFDIANTIVWGTVRGISDDYGIEIDLDAVNVSDQNLWFTEYYAADYRQIFSIYEGNAAEWGGKLTLEGTIQAENGHKHSLILDNGDEVTLWGGISEELSSVGENAIYDSFDGLRVRVYGKMLSMNLTISVDYIYPIVQ